jgi:HSP20 family molecular chaperone IbpA
VKAVYKNGVLELVIPKPAEERTQARTIPVTTA